MRVICEMCGHAPKRYDENQMSGGCDYCELMRENASLKAEIMRLRAESYDEGEGAMNISDHAREAANSVCEPMGDGPVARDKRRMKAAAIQRAIDAATAPHADGEELVECDACGGWWLPDSMQPTADGEGTVCDQCVLKDSLTYERDRLQSFVERLKADSARLTYLIQHSSLEGADEAIVLIVTEAAVPYCPGTHLPEYHAAVRAAIDANRKGSECYE